jgi:hypothetical protein
MNSGHGFPPAQEGAERKPSPEGGRRYRHCGVFVIEVRFPHDNVRHICPADVFQLVEQGAFVGDGHQDDAVRPFVPEAGRLGMLEREVECRVGRLCSLQAERKVCPSENVEPLGRIEVALDVMHDGNLRAPGTRVKHPSMPEFPVRTRQFQCRPRRCGCGH